MTIQEPKVPSNSSAVDSGENQQTGAIELAVELQGLPIERVGQDDPLKPDRSQGFPHILYHGTKAKDFALDDSRNHRNSVSGTGARTGAGLYAASETASRTFGTGEVVELIPHNAQLLDLDAPEASQPLS